VSTRICVIGAGLAGSLLAWRLAGSEAWSDAGSEAWSGAGSDAEPDAESGAGSRAGARTVELVTGTAGTPDATAASRGLVRAFETDPAHAENARASLAELVADPVLRQWAGYQSTGSTYVLPDGPPDPAAYAALVAGAPGAVRLASAAELAEAGWHGLPEQAVAVVEEEAGHIDPDRLRRSATADFAGRRGATVLAEPVRRVVVRPGGVRVHLASGPRDYDVAVVAAGAWTPALLHASDLPAEGLTTKAIQYTVVPTRGPRPTAFVDETSGLFGRPLGDGMMVGLPTEVWGVDPDAPKAEPALEREALRLAALRFPALEVTGRPATTVSADCYGTPAGLRLAAVPGTGGRVHTFSGGSGGSAKTALAASTRAADDLRRR
jgi:glycine/D-amino acid oxidase-like deaminating enzyme